MKIVGATGTVATVIEATGTAVMIAIVIETGMETEIATTTGTGIATVAAAVVVAAVTVTAVTEMEAGGTEMIGEVTGTGETRVVERGGTEVEMTALLSLNHQNVERAGGTTKIKTSLW